MEIGRQKSSISIQPIAQDQSGWVVVGAYHIEVPAQKCGQPGLGSLALISTMQDLPYRPGRDFIRAVRAVRLALECDRQKRALLVHLIWRGLCRISLCWLVEPRSWFVVRTIDHRP